MRVPRKLSALLLGVSTACQLFAADAALEPDTRPELVTIAEQSQFARTGRYDEVQRLCVAFARHYPKMVRCHEFGRTPEGRPMLALVVSASGVLQPQLAKQRGLPVVLVQGGIHAGEIDGKDAGLLLLRQMLADPQQAAVLAQQVLVFVPVFNVDGHERFGRWNRPNQRGPEQMGWRTTAQNVNLNRDYAKADSAEMAAMLTLVQQWDPLATVDLHVTDGAQFEHDVSIQVEPVHAGDAGMRLIGRAWRDGVIDSLRQQGSLPLPFYYEFAEEDNPASGFIDKVLPPRYSHGYFHWRNRMGMLVEAHSWKDYPTRVQLMHKTIAAVLQQTAQFGKQWLAVAQQADQRAQQLGGQSIALTYQASEQSRMIDFKGYAYTRSQSDISGATMVRYDESRPQIWRVPLRDQIEPKLLATAPLGGYLVPAAHAKWLGAKLALHGISFRTIGKPLPALAVQAWRAEQTSISNKSMEGRQRMDAQGAWHDEQHTLAAGSLFVPIAQNRARLIVALLEPQAPDSFVSWGFFNQAFEQKEYMEDYVAEQVAREQLAADPALQAEFARKLATDAAFAKDPQARLTFFARRHPSWDTRYRLYPVLRLPSPSLPAEK